MAGIQIAIPFALSHDMDCELLTLLEGEVFLYHVTTLMADG
jgi:hypothetical protein